MHPERLSCLRHRCGPMEIRRGFHGLRILLKMDSSDSPAEIRRGSAAKRQRSLSGTRWSER